MEVIVEKKLGEAPDPCTSCSDLTVGQKHRSLGEKRAQEEQCHPPTPALDASGEGQRLSSWKVFFVSFWHTAGLQG